MSERAREIVVNRLSHLEYIIGMHESDLDSLRKRAEKVEGERASAQLERDELKLFLNRNKEQE